MSMITYTNGIPNAPNNPSFDQPNMKVNNDNIPIYLAVDHVPFNVDNSGYHTVIHQVPNGGLAPVDPAVTLGFNQLYSKNHTITNSAGSVTDTQVFTQSSLGQISQLTGYNATINGGFQFLGGLILQFGIFNAQPSSTGTILFNTAPNFNFPTDCFNVQCTLIAKTGGTSSSNTIAPIDGTVSKTGFDYSYTGSNSYVGFYWMAVGN